MKKKIAMLLILTFLNSSTIRSEDVVLLNKTDPAPYTGFLFPREKALEFRKVSIENDELKLINSSFQRSIELYKVNQIDSDKQVNILLNRNDQLAKDLTSARSMTGWEKIGWFVGGILVTGAAVYGASKIVGK